LRIAYDGDIYCCDERTGTAVIRGGRIIAGATVVRHLAAVVKVLVVTPGKLTAPRMYARE
jgi:RecB family endonuclease NucS